MKIVIELCDDNGKPFGREQGEKALRMMLRDGTEQHGCLELADMEGRALLARVEGVVEEKYDALVPYVAPPIGEDK